IGEKYNIVMNMTGSESRMSGNYYYTKYGEPISFSYSSKIDALGKFVIEEESLTDDDKNRGIFRGSFIDEHTISGFWKKSSSNDSLKFRLTETYTDGAVKCVMKYFHKEVDSVVSISFEYPELKAADNINKTINKELLGKENKTIIHTKDFDEAMIAYVQRYKKEVLEDTLYGEYKPPYFSETSLKIFFNTGSILSLEGFGYVFEGGAHGNYFYNYSNFDLKTGNQIQYADIFREDHKAELNNVGEKIFRERFKVDPNQSLAEQGWFGFENGFYVSDNFAICKGGLLIRYNPYEAGAYALGAPSIFIPYKEIKNILKEKSVLERIF
ncbi:MAG: DUF3298 and DUF4163 domain-containing protein, partial [Ignavibacteriaceae bacterium]|nr:DUF3298 and DUF4163 domain-containing protein [Ignavibacteriaceae bacterium]